MEAETLLLRGLQRCDLQVHKVKALPLPPPPPPPCVLNSKSSGFANRHKQVHSRDFYFVDFAHSTRAPALKSRQALLAYLISITWDHIPKKNSTFLTAKYSSSTISLYKGEKNEWCSFSFLLACFNLFSSKQRTTVSTTHSPSMCNDGHRSSCVRDAAFLYSGFSESWHLNVVLCFVSLRPGMLFGFENKKSVQASTSFIDSTFQSFGRPLFFVGVVAVLAKRSAVVAVVFLRQVFTI